MAERSFVVQWLGEVLLWNEIFLGFVLPWLGVKRQWNSY